jgi:hypothetical protein
MQVWVALLGYRPRFGLAWQPSVPPGQPPRAQPVDWGRLIGALHCRLAFIVAAMAGC